jgi:hypothetical protein
MGAPKIADCRKEKPGMLTILTAIGNLCLVSLSVALPFRALYEYKRSPQHPRTAVMEITIMMLLALLNILGWVLPFARLLRITNPAILAIVLFDLNILLYCWTSPSETWVRKRRKWFIVMAVLSVILGAACILLLVSIFFGEPF